MPKNFFTKLLSLLVRFIFLPAHSIFPLLSITTLSAIIFILLMSCVIVIVVEPNLLTLSNINSLIEFPVIGSSPAVGSSKIKNSGSICLGKYAVMAMTDYNIGSNHILPTNGSAKYSSGISVNEFYKRISYINLSKKGIESLGPSVITLANYEGLAGHAQSVKKRIRRK